MPQNTLITVLRGKLPVQLPYKALMGEYSDRLIKAHGGNVTISDPDLDVKLSSEEYASLQAKYPHIGPPAQLPPEPPLLDAFIAEAETPKAEEVSQAEPTETETAPAPKKRGRKPKHTEDAAN